MKVVYRSMQQVARLMVISLTLLACILPMGAAAENSPALSKKELKKLLATAKTPESQQRLAAYYRDKARSLTAKSEEFARQAELLAKQPSTIESKQGISCNCASHYRYFSRLYAQEARDSEVLAAQHDQQAAEQR